MLFRFAPERCEADGFIIRGYDVGDEAALWEAVDVSREHLRTMPWIDAYTDVLAATAYVRGCRAAYLRHVDFALGIWSTDEAELLGSTGFHLHGAAMDPARTAEIGMWIRVDRAGRGLGTRVLRQLLQWGFETWGWMRLSWRCDTANIASMRCAERAGMLREGTHRGEYEPVSGGRRDSAHYGLTMADYRSSE